jgi:signal transduction histidine kinase
LNDVVQDTLKLLGDRFLREVQVSFQPTPELPGVLAAKEFVQQILLNFIFNAAESMEASKQIVLSTRVISELPADLVLLPVPSARYAAVSVKDSGCGIPSENLPRIFEPFFTTKALSTRRGTGLGLSMVYELAKKLGAGLLVDSAVGRGSTFTLVLPVRDLAGQPTNVCPPSV